MPNHVFWASPLALRADLVKTMRSLGLPVQAEIPERIRALHEEVCQACLEMPLPKAIAFFMDRLLRCPPVLHKRPSGRVAWPSDVWQEVEAEARSHLVGPALVLAERFARFNDESIALSDDGVDHVVEVLDHLAEQATQDSLSAKSQNSPMGPLRHRLREPTIESAPIRDALALVLNELLRTPSPWEPNQLELFAENPARDELLVRRRKHERAVLGHRLSYVEHVGRLETKVELLDNCFSEDLY